mgnify:FL=1
MKNSHSESYAAAGVDVTAGYEAVERIKPMVESTYIPGVMGTLGGFGAGVINGLLGAGGGMVVVPLLSALGVRGKKSHATALMVIVPLSLVSAILYLVQGRVTVMDALPWLPGSLLGAYLGSRLMPKISTGWLKLVFGGLMLWGGIRLL